MIDGKHEVVAAAELVATELLRLERENTSLREQLRVAQERIPKWVSVGERLLNLPSRYSFYFVLAKDTRTCQR
jgi:hypothetical protein